MGLYVPYARTDQKGLFRPGPIIDESLIFGGFLWHPDLSMSPFLTKDATKHSCTVTEATWGTQGRTFDGSNDFISVPDNAMFSFGNSLVDSPFSVLGWIKPDSTAPGTLISKYGEVAAVREWYILFRSPEQDIIVGLCDSSVAKYSYRLANAVTTMNVWHQIGFTYAGTGGATAANGIIIYEDGAVKASTAANDAAYVAMENTAQNVWIAKASAGFGKGIIGEIMIYNRVLTAGEVMHNYLATKWRYI